jgi:hypothetical protein
MTDFFISTSVRAVFNCIPIFGPGLSPSHFFFTNKAGLGLQVTLIAQKCGFHRNILICLAIICFSLKERLNGF